MTSSRLCPVQGLPSGLDGPRRSRDYLATDSVRSKLPPLSVPVSPSPVSREASREFVARDRPFDDGRVQTMNVVVSTSTVSANILPDLVFMFRAKRPLYLRHMSDIHEAAKKGMSDERLKIYLSVHTTLICPKI